MRKGWGGKGGGGAGEALALDFLCVLCVCLRLRLFPHATRARRGVSSGLCTRRRASLPEKEQKGEIQFLTCGGDGVRHMGERGHSSCTKTEESISEMWGKRGATYGEKGVCVSA